MNMEVQMPIGTGWMVLEVPTCLFFVRGKKYPLVFICGKKCPLVFRLLMVKAMFARDYLPKLVLLFIHENSIFSHNKSALQISCSRAKILYSMDRCIECVHLLLIYYQWVIWMIALSKCTHACPIFVLHWMRPLASPAHGCGWMHGWIPVVRYFIKAVEFLSNVLNKKNVREHSNRPPIRRAFISVMICFTHRLPQEIWDES